MLQEIMEQKVDPLYPIGFRIQKGDWTLHYCKASARGIETPAIGAGNALHQLEATCIGNAVAGTYILDIPKQHADYAHAWKPSPVEYSAKDVYKDGYVWIMGEGADRTKHEMHRIKRNDAWDGTKVRLYLYEKIKASQTTPWITIYPNFYSSVENEYPNYPDGKMGIVCVSLIPVTPNYHFWGVTWGPMWVPAYDKNPGEADYYREVYFRLPGGLITLTREIDLTAVCFQRAGFVLPYTGYSGIHNATPWGGDPCIMLQIAP